MTFTLRMISLAQSSPNSFSFTSSLRFVVAASRMENTGSVSQEMHRSSRERVGRGAEPEASSGGSILDLKNSEPSWEASSGTYLMMASLTRQWRSSASSTIDGMRLVHRFLTPITWFTLSSLEMMLSLTSGKSSASSPRNTGKSLSMVASFPMTGAMPMMTEASDDLTCWLASTASSFTTGRTRSGASLGRNSTKDVTRPAAAMRTSASVSLRRSTNICSIFSLFAVSGPTTTHRS
mmetsp:Transcript_16739/g.57137  ORF Transcript_16739/g.57137 Transcript_16739/m.57137 type:complete len:236 (+) Transcript_16739:423-1130(+)